MILRAGWIAFALVVAVWAVSGTLASAQDEDSRFDSTDPAKAPLSVSLSQIENRINGDPAADGIVLAITVKDEIMRIDLKAMPGTTSVAAATRVIFMIGRLAEPDYTELRFSDEGKDLFVIDGDAIRGIGRQFVWGEEGRGQNPIHLIRLFVDALRYPDGTRVAPEFTGSLLGDTTVSTRTMVDVFNPEWVLKNTKVL